MRFALVLGAAVLFSSGAWADCTPRKSTTDAFGRFQLGAVTRAQMDAFARRTPDCDFANDNVCTYRDKAGIEYRFVDGFIEAKTLILGAGRKQPRVWSLSRADTPATVRRKIKLRFGLNIGPAQDPHESVTGECFENANGVAHWLWFRFDARNHLSAFGTRMIPVRL